MPTVRGLADELGVSPSTVSAALADLRARGLIISRERSRSHVSWRPPISGAALPRRIPAGVRDLATGNPDPTLLPDLSRFLRRLEPDVQLYGGDYAIADLTELAAAAFAATGIEATNLAVVSGALDGIERAMAARLRPGDLVAVEDPGFPGLFDLLRALGLALYPVAIDEAGMRPDALAEALDAGVAAVAVNTRGQNPTGAALDPGRAAELRRVLDAAPHVLVVEDDHLGPIAGADRITLTGGRERWAAARSVAKSLGPDIRLAVLAGDEQTISRVRGRQAVGPQWVSHLLQRLTVAMWTDPEVAATLERAESTYRCRREGLIAELAARGIDGSGRAGINVWVPVPDEASIVQALREEGWAVSPGGPFRLQSAAAIRVTISALDAAGAAELAAALERALRPTDRTRAG